MKLALATTIAVVAAATQGAQAFTAQDASSQAFDLFKRTFDKDYETAEEEAQRFAAFQASMLRVAKSGNPAAGITKFSDLSADEFKAKYLTRSKRVTRDDAFNATVYDPVTAPCLSCERFPEITEMLKPGNSPTSFDWRTKGAVTAVKDQGQCGSCWSFGTTGDIEGVHFLAGNKLVSLSEQELVSCDTKGEDQGCNGGLQEDAFAYVIKTGGLVAESEYKYTSGNGNSGRCNKKKTKSNEIVASISSWNKVSSSAKGETAIETALLKSGPITIGIDAGPMQDYTSGIDNPSDCGSGRFDLDHAVLVVGFGESKGKKYWIIKNSWNTDWGEDGYYRIVKGVNKCGVAMDAVHSKA